MSIGRVVVAGRDAPLWLTALALDQALVGSGISIEVVELPSALQPGEAIAASPSLTALHRRIGIDRGEILRAANGIRVGGQYFRGWGPTRFLLGFEDAAVAERQVSISQCWAAERLAGSGGSRDRLSPAAVAMARGRIARDGGGDPYGIATGYHFDAQGYAAALSDRARARRLAVRQSASCRPISQGDRIVAIALDDNDLAADLFVDVSGADALLISELPDDRWTSHGDRIPTRRLSWSSAPPLVPRPPFTDVSREPEGWHARFALADRTAILVADISDRSGMSSLFEPGLRTPWRHNVVAVGDAACRLEPVDHLGLHMTHVGIANLIAWFPASDQMAVEREKYNLAVEAEGGHLLDYQACRYDQHDGDPTCALARRTSLFDAMGMVAALDHDPIDPAQWERYFAGLGRCPSSAGARAMSIPAVQRQAMLGAFVSEIDRHAATLPTVLEDLQR